ncbi:MAG: S9 family peptidase, partial [Pseudomonadota bacterium]
QLSNFENGIASANLSPSESRVLVRTSDDSAAPRQLTTGDAGGWDARWSADGDSIYFLSDLGEGTQLYRQSVDDDEEAEQLSNFENGIASANLSPSESRVLVRTSDDELRGKLEDPEPIVVTRRHFKRDAGHGYITDGSLNHLHVYDIESHELRRLTSGNFNDGDADWSPDGQHVVFASNRQPVPDSDYRADIFVIDVEAAEPAPRRLTDDDRTKSSPTFSPDGETVAFLSAEDGVYALQRIAVIPAKGGEAKLLTSDFDRAIWSYQWSPDGEWIYFQFDNRGASSVGRVNVSTGHMESLITGEQTVGSFDVSTSGAIAFVSEAGATGPNLYQFHKKRTVAVTDVNRAFFDQVTLGEKRKVTVQSSDGVTVDTFITLPTNYQAGRKYPAVLHIHGGPVGQFAWGFNFEAQFYANNGYVVIEPNPRGSSGRGQAFMRSIYRSWGVPDYDDVMAAVDYAVEEGIADPDRLVVTGFSYGGYMTNVAITETDRFAAAVSGAGHSLIEANVGHDMYSQWYFWELGAPWENRDRYDVHSPYLRVGNVTTPTLFYGGRVDWNVPVLNAELMYQALQVLGVESQLVVYPDSHHGGWDEGFEKDALTRTVDWFDRYAKSE